MIHVILSKTLNFEKIAAESAADRSPGHVLLDLARQAEVRIHIPDPNLTPSSNDRLRSRLFSKPHLWALARRVVAQATADDVIFCTGEDVGIPVATLAMRRRSDRPRVAMFVHNLARPRARAAMCLYGCAPAVTHWLTNAQPQADFITRTLGVGTNEITFIPEQTDTRFFTPGAPSAPVENPRGPLIVSVGLEQRDYRRLAAATAGLAVDVRISGFSTDARAMKDAFPEALPANMTRAFYDWNALRDLYRQADLVVVPLFENPYCAGLTSLLEGMACQKPVIITRTEGVETYLLNEHANEGEVCLTVRPGDAGALRAAIESVLRSPAVGQRLGTSGYAYLQAHHTPAHWLSAMMPVLASAPRAATATPRRGPNLLQRLTQQFRSTRGLPSPLRVLSKA